MMQKQNNQNNQLNQEHRVEIYKLLWQNKSAREIWKILWFHHTTIYREINRNSIDYWRWRTKYKPLVAEKKRVERRFNANQNHIKLRKNTSLRTKIYHILSDTSKDRWPDEILGRLKLEWRAVVSTSTLYKYIRAYTDRRRYLRHKKKWYKKNKRKKTETILWVNKIDKRPGIINNRERIWDFEIDTVVSCRGWKWWLFTATDRKSKYEIIKKVWNLKSKTLLITMLACLKWESVYSLTSDNWSEFAKLSELQELLKITCYTAHPYSSFERWTNEKHNWFIRRYIPKGSDISKYTDKEIQIIQNKLNHKPRKILDYLTPYEVYHNTKLNYTT